MEYVWEIVLTVLCLMGLGLLVWCLMGRLVCPVPGQEVLAVLEGQGDGGGLEQSVRALMWLRSLGLLRCPVVIVDLGLDREGPGGGPAARPALAGGGPVPPGGWGGGALIQERRCPKLEDGRELELVEAPWPL